MSKGMLILVLFIAVAVGVVALLLLPDGEEEAALPKNNVPAGQIPDRDYTLNELGVLIRVPEILAGLKHTTEKSDVLGTVLLMTAEGLPDKCVIGVFYSVDKSKPRPEGMDEWLEAALKQQGDAPPQAKDFGDFYLVFEPAQAPCSNTEDGVRRESDMRASLWRSVIGAEIR